MTAGTVFLGDICEFVRGITFPSGDGKSIPSENSIACLTTSGVQKEVAWRSRRYVPLERVSNDRQLLRDGDVLISTANSKELVGKSCLVRRPPFPCSFGAFVTVARPCERVDPRYLAYWMKTSSFLAWCFKTSSNTTNISNLRTSALEGVSFPLVSLSKQQQIAEVLEQADRLCHTRRYALELSDNVLPAAFLEFFGNPEKNTKGWQLAKLGAVCQKKDGIKAGPFGSSLKKESYATSGVRVYGQEQVIAGDFNVGNYYISEEMFADFSSYEVKPGDVLVSLVGSFGKVVVVPEGIERGIINPRLLKISPDPEQLLPVFLAKLMEHPVTQRQFVRMSHGGTMGILNAGLLRDWSVILPPISLQKQFVEMVERHERLCATQREALRQAEHLFQTLLHRAFTVGI